MVGSLRLRRSCVGSFHLGGPPHNSTGSATMCAAVPGSALRGGAGRRQVGIYARFAQRLHGFSCFHAAMAPVSLGPTVEQSRVGDERSKERSSNCIESVSNIFVVTNKGIDGAPVDDANVPGLRSMQCTLRDALEVSGSVLLSSTTKGAKG
ncbi:hypothetical protein ABL78_8406 [Leptomonas seymouri]|uniref:Uncharacterized protein n=1 Tax=Leptomonas seymouri TaxID=5684 RepID=A0A0N1IH39_LEPSE|nr:hypothetical protein ABL78_8406 [Leptomonas seymouri]|eukprot:KPI82584.1 hypothetical protein ABL78_8406 [Leptomonas seymouri]